MTAMKAISQRPDPAHSPLPAYNARDLTEGGDQARIVLDGQIYTLRITRAGKLILTK
jgi:hemin uptake protein HemP